MNAAKYIDHTLLKPEVTDKEISVLCDEAHEHGFFSVCIQPTWVKNAAEKLAESEVKVCTVNGFPHGETTSEFKAIENKHAISNGEEEMDMLINISQHKAGNLECVKEHIKSVVDAANKEALVKVIIES